MNTTETWRLVPSVPYLLASSEGRIMAIPKIGEMPNGKGQRQYGGKPTFGQWDGTRFIYVGPDNKTRKVARLVCEAFNGPPPPGKNVCMHLDENSRNNKPGNLEWGTQKENLNAPGFLSYCRSRTGANSPTTKARMRAQEQT